MSADLVDLRAVYEFEKAVHAFRQAREAVWPALERLQDSGYPGAQFVVDDFLLDEDVDHLANSLEDMRLADGDDGAALFSHFVKRRPENATARAALEEGVGHLIEWENGPARVEAMLRYAKSVA